MIIDDGRRRVLIVDDHESFRSMARVLLEAGGFLIVGEAATGAEALLAVAVTRPDVVLLDVQLPDTDGFRVARSLEPMRDVVSVVLCSVRDAADYGSAVHACGASGFISKSQLSANALRKILRW